MKLNADNKILRSAVNAVVQQVLTMFPLMFLCRGEETVPAGDFQIVLIYEHNTFIS